jgi:hypothetical protein
MKTGTSGTFLLCSAVDIGHIFHGKFSDHADGSGIFKAALICQSLDLFIGESDPHIADGDGHFHVAVELFHGFDSF